MLFLIMVLAGAGAFVEMKAIATWPWFGDLVSKYRLLSLGFSFGLSILLAIPFGAGGLIVFAAGLVSTVMMQPYYALRKNGGLEVIREKRAAAKQSYHDNKDHIVHRYNQLVAVVRLIFAVVVLPFKLLGWMADGVERVFGNKKTVREEVIV